MVSSALPLDHRKGETMVIMEQCDLKQLHLRPVRMNLVHPRAKTLENGPWILHIQDSLIRFYHPASTDKNRAVLADEFDVTEIRDYRSRSKFGGQAWYLLYGYLINVSDGVVRLPHGRRNVEKSVTLISITAYSDEEVAEAILFRTQIAYLIEDVKRFWVYKEGERSK